MQRRFPFPGPGLRPLTFSRAFAALLVPAAALSVVLVARAQAVDDDLMTIDITGPPGPHDISRSSINVRTIEAADLRAQQPASVQEALRNVMGVHVDNSTARGATGSLYLRGADPNLAVIRLDGVVLNDPLNTRGGSFDLSTLEPDDIDFVRIAPGPLATLYSLDGLAGVVDIRTHPVDPEDPVEADLALGSRGYGKVRVSGSGAAGGMGLRGTAYATDNGEQIPADAFTGKGGSIAVSGERGGGYYDARLEYLDTESESFPDDSGGPVFARLREVERRDTEAVIAYAKSGLAVNSRTSIEGRVQYYGLSSLTSSPGVAPGPRDPFGIPPTRTDDRFDRVEAELKAGHVLRDELSVSGSVTLRRESGDSESEVCAGSTCQPSGFSLDRDTLSAAAAVHADLLPTLGTVAVARSYWIPGEEAELAPAAGLVFRPPGSSARLKASWGEGFRLPSFFALGNPIVGDPALRPERSRGWEAGLEWERPDGAAAAGVNVFSTDYRDLIDLAEGPPPSLVNRSRVTTRGVEGWLELAWAEGVGLDAHVTYVDADIAGVAEPLRNRPRWRAGAGLRGDTGAGVVLGATIEYVGERIDSSIPTGEVTLSSYWAAGGHVSWQLSPASELNVAVDNMFDADYQAAVGFPGAGASIRVQLSRAL